MGKLCFCLLLLILGVGRLSAQGDTLLIGEISIQGNQITKDKVILRELLFQTGDVLPDSLLDAQVERSRQLVMNTGLFNRTEITTEEQENGIVHVNVQVEEAWYIYPVPVFELIDRNFNVWWVEQNRSLDRINFGVEFAHLNFTGQNDKLKLTAQYGYTRSYTLKYSLPFIDRKQTLGIITEFSYARNRELNYNSINNKQLFYKHPDEKFIFQRLWAYLGLVYRPGHHLTHSLHLRYQQHAVDEIVATELNPDFFLNGRRLQRGFSLHYNFSYDLRDVRSYPLQGNLFNMEIRKDGLGFFQDLNALTLATSYDHYWPLSGRWSTGMLLSSKLSLIRRQQPFLEYRAFGFGRNNLPGYEYYVINGLDMVLLKTFLRWRLAEKELNFGKAVPIKAFRKMPVKVYLSLNQGLSLVNDPFTREINPFGNQLLWGGGFGLDVVLYYDKVFRIQYSYNHLWEHGLFLHFNTNI